jgi:hypothetical protein
MLQTSVFYRTNPTKECDDADYDMLALWRWRCWRSRTPITMIAAAVEVIECVCDLLRGAG